MPRGDDDESDENSCNDPFVSVPQTDLQLSIMLY